MGAWGHQLTANDRALDLIDEMADKQSEFLVKCFNDDNQDSFGRLGLLEASLSGLAGWHVFYSLKETNVVDRALYDIEYLLKCDEWIAGWNEPKKLKSTLNKFKKKLEKLVEENKEN